MTAVLHILHLDLHHRIKMINFITKRDLNHTGTH